MACARCDQSRQPNKDRGVAILGGGPLDRHQSGTTVAGEPPTSEHTSCVGNQRWRVIMRSDSDIRRDVEDELRWDPDIDDTDIAVNVNNGIVTLAGFIRSYVQKYQAETAAK